MRTLRRARNLTIAQVADAAGLTKGFVSRLERDHTSVSIAALLRICDVLHASPGALFDDPAAALVRDGEAPVIDFGERRMRYAHQTPASVQDMRALKIMLDAGGGAGSEEYALHGGTEFLYVLRGRLVLELEGENLLLGPGDCLTFPGRTPHTYRNASRRERCELLWVIAPAT